MTYSPGSPGYSPTQPGGSYAGTTPSFTKDDDGESKLPQALNLAVAVLGFLAYLASFGPLATVNVEIGGAAVSGAGSALGVVAALLAGLLAAVGLLPKAKSYAGVAAAIAVLGALLEISEIVNMGSGVSIGWGLWLILVFSVLQAIAAIYALLLDAGVVTAPKPRPKQDPYAQYGQYGQQYGQYGQYGQQPYYGQPGAPQYPGQQPHNAQQPVGQQPHNAQQPPGYGSQYGGYPSSHAPTPAPSGPAPTPSPQSLAPTQVSIPTTSGGFGAPPAAQQQGTNTPPTGFPSFGSPPSAGAGGTDSSIQTEGHEAKESEQQQSSGPAAPE